MQVACPNCFIVKNILPAEIQIECCQVCGEYFIVDIRPINYTFRITAREMPKTTPEEMDAADKRYYLNRLEEMAA